MRPSLERLEDRCCPSAASDLVAANIAAYNNSLNGIASQTSSARDVLQEGHLAMTAILNSNMPADAMQQQESVNRDMTNQLSNCAANLGRASAQQTMARVWLQVYMESQTDSRRLFAAQHFSMCVSAMTNFQQNAQGFIYSALNDYSQNMTTVGYYNSP